MWRSARGIGVKRSWSWPDCAGRPLLSEYGRPELPYVRAGTLDRLSRVTPDVHIFTRSKVSWITIPESTPAFEVYYDIEAPWPVESLERLNSLLASDSAQFDDPA